MNYGYLKQDSRIRVLGQPEPGSVIVQDGLQYPTPENTNAAWQTLAIGCLSQAAEQPYPNAVVWVVSVRDAQNPCEPDAATALDAVMMGIPPVMVLVNMTGQKAEVITASDLTTVAELTRVGGDYAILPTRPSAPTALAKSKQEALPIVIGTAAGGALGFALGGPVGAVSGAVGGAILSAWLT